MQYARAEFIFAFNLLWAPHLLQKDLMEARPGFSLQFLLQFWRLHLIFYSSHLSLLVFFLFIGASCLYTFLGYRVGLISGELHQLGFTSNCAWPGNFYKVLVDRDHDQFVWECLTSTGLVVAISVIKYGTTTDIVLLK